jgi:Holliday junction resolvasome RuvABC endonuclease subunit
VILGLDPSTKCGWAVLDPAGGRVASGVWNLKPGDAEGSGARFFKLHVELGSLLLEYPEITWVAYECPGGHFSNQHAMLCVVGLAMHVESFCERERLQYAGYAPAEVKRVAGVKGKDKPIAQALELWGHTVKDGNEADALFCALALQREQRF